ncbi:hypothetical protein ABPG72_002605 [Tetrahymena utriculariae]
MKKRIIIKKPSKKVEETQIDKSQQKYALDYQQYEHYQKESYKSNKIQDQNMSNVDQYLQEIDYLNDIKIELKHEELNIQNIPKEVLYQESSFIAKDNYLSKDNSQQPKQEQIKNEQDEIQVILLNQLNKNELLDLFKINFQDKNQRIQFGNQPKTIGQCEFSNLEYQERDKACSFAENKYQQIKENLQSKQKNKRQNRDSKIEQKKVQKQMKYEDENKINVNFNFIDNKINQSSKLFSSNLKEANPLQNQTIDLKKYLEYIQEQKKKSIEIDTKVDLLLDQLFNGISKMFDNDSVQYQLDNNNNNNNNIRNMQEFSTNQSNLEQKTQKINSDFTNSKEKFSNLSYESTQNPEDQLKFQRYKNQSLKKQFFLIEKTNNKQHEKIFNNQNIQRQVDQQQDEKINIFLNDFMKNQQQKLEITLQNELNKKDLFENEVFRLLLDYSQQNICLLQQIKNIK